MRRQISLFSLLLLFLILTSGLANAQMNAQLSTPLCNPNANKETLELKAFLDSVYGKKMISGHCNDKYLQYIKDATGGKAPALMGYDFNGICPSQGGNTDAQKAINWAKNQGGIVQFQWHWISPDANGDFYTKNFNLASALADTNSTSYKNIIRDIDLVARELKKLQEAGVPVLWRPLHEAEGKWFWWGMAGGDACRKLWRLMYNRYTNLHKLNNLIWVWNSYGTTKENWFPGSDVVDIIAWDYADYSASGSWYQYKKLFGPTGKLFAIGEEGKVPDPNIMAAQPWLYFMTWDYMIQEPTVKDGKNTKQWLYQVYNDSRVITLDDLTPGPKAYAGLSQTIFDTNGDSVETVILDGSASRTDNGTITNYSWTENGVELSNAVKDTISLGLGTHNIKLTITTSTNETKYAFVVFTIKRSSLSLKKPFKASSTEANLGNVAANAVDGVESTRWSSLYSDPQWYQIDLGQPSKIDEVVLSWEFAAAKDFSIDLSDDEINWTSIVTKANMPAGPRVDRLTGLNASGRYIRMYGSKRTSQYGYSIYEFEVYGSPNTSSAADNPTVPVSTALFQNYPNPFNPETIISYELKENSSVRLCVYDILGREVASLVNGPQNAGMHKIVFNASGLSSGIYFYELVSGSFYSSKKMQVIK